MTIASPIARTTAIGNGATTVYPYTFRILKAADIQVLTRSAGNGAETVHNYPVDYTVAGVGNTSGGSVVFASAPTNGDTVVIRRNRALTQETSLTDQGAYFAKDTETALDGLLTIDQQQQDQLDRGLSFPVTVADTVSTVLPIPAADAVLVWNSVGTALTNRVLDASTNVALPTVAGTAATLTAYLSNTAVANAKNFGAIADGSSHPLSTRYATLAAAQAVYPFVTSLTQEIDWAACQLMSNTALGWGGAEHGDTNARLNVPMMLPGGSYMFGASTWLIRNASGIKLTGAMSRATKLFGSGIVFATDGLWYSEMSDLDVTTTGAVAAAMDIDGNVPGHPYATRGVQSNTFRKINVFGSAVATYGFALTRLGNPPGPGAQGSENLFEGCTFQDCVEANWYSTGYNALQNTFIGGNFQGHKKHGISIYAGSINLFSVGFQSTYGYQQIVNGGYDIDANNGGVDDRIVVIGCRTESARFYRGGGSQKPVLIGNKQSYGSDATWGPATAYTLGLTIVKTSPTHGPQLYRVTTAGTTGATEPTWPDSGTVADGAVVWTMTPVNVIDVAGGILDGNVITFGYIASSNHDLRHQVKELNASYVAKFDDEFLLVDATAAAVTITLPSAAFGGYLGKRFVIKKVDTSANAITVKNSDGSNLDGGIVAAIIQGGSRGFVEVVLGGGGLFSSRQWIISKSLDTDPTIRRLLANAGTALVAADFALSAGFGSTAAVSAVLTGSRDARGQITISSAGVGQAANPTVTLTFKDGTFAGQAYATVCRAGGSQRTVPVEVNSVSPTNLVISFLGTPVAGETYSIAWQVQG